MACQEADGSRAADQNSSSVPMGLPLSSKQAKKISIKERSLLQQSPALRTEGTRPFPGGANGSQELRP